MKNLFCKRDGMPLCDFFKSNYSLSFFLCFVLMLTVSCSKSKVEDSSAEKIRINLKVAYFEQTPFEKAVMSKADMKAVCSSLVFVRYENGKREEPIYQKNDETDFGSFQMDLTEGQHVIMLLGHNGDVNPSFPTTTNNNGSVSITFKNQETLKTTDTFFYCDTIQVSKESTSFEICLKRVVSMFRLTIEDDIPDNMSALKIEVNGNSTSLNSKTQTSSSDAGQTEILPINSTSKKVFEIYAIPNDKKNLYDITISALDVKNRPCKVINLKDVPLKKNYITKYSGKFFEGGCLSYQEVTVPVMIDDEWIEGPDSIF